MSGDGASRVMSQEAPTVWMTAPKFDTRLALQTSRKMR
jgi:hypothetical protein